MSEAVGAGLPKAAIWLWVAVLVVFLALGLLWIAQELQARPPGKPCKGCSDADLGLVLDEPEPNHAKGAKP